MVFVGSQGFVQYSVDTANWSTWKTFGIGTRVRNISVRNNIERIPVLGKRSAEALIPLRYEGAWGIETFPTSISTLATDLGWDESVTSPVKFGILAGIQGNEYRFLKNSIVNRVGITARQGEMVRMTIDGLFEKELVDSTKVGIEGQIQTEYNLATPPDITILSESGTPATFAEGSVLDGATEVGLVQSFDISINVNPNPIYALGSRYFQDAYLRMLEVEGRMTVVLQDISWLNDIENVEEHSSIKLDLGAVGSVTIELAKANELSHAIEPNELVIADIVFIGKTVTFV